MVARNLLYTPPGPSYRFDMTRLIVRSLTRIAPLAAFAFSAAAGAQQAAPPPVGDLEKPPAFLYYLVAAVFLGVVIVLSIMPSKRREEG